MQRIFKTQKITAVIYSVVAVAVFLYTLMFMTEYKDLFGLKLKQNSQISFFHDSVLQTFNRQIFLLALVGIFAILFSVLLETLKKVPDVFALVVMEIMLVICCAGCVYALSNISAIEAFYKTLDFQFLELEGLTDYELRFTAFNAGIVIYILQIIACSGKGMTLALSHVTYR